MINLLPSTVDHISKLSSDAFLTQGNCLASQMIQAQNGRSLPPELWSFDTEDCCGRKRAFRSKLVTAVGVILCLCPDCPPAFVGLGDVGADVVDALTILIRASGGSFFSP